ncbi:MAG: DUF1302 domain-containing protein [Betaproteobacteria bacterium]|nr:DUF1302 domain-containing protein [Betaproteobacteria bacterium]
MKNAKKGVNVRSGFRRRVIAAAVVSSLSAWSAAHAVDFDTGNQDLAVRWDNTLRYNYAYRVQEQNPNILASPNFDDGDRNFNKGTVANRIDLLSEFDFVYRKVNGFRVSAAAWYDNAYGQLDNTSVASSNHMVGGAPALGLGDTARRFLKGPSGEILDAFVFGQTELGGRPLNLKVGRHTLVWGESLLSPLHGVNYGQSPLDFRKGLAVPGVEAKEVFLPRNAISAQLLATPELALAAQYFLEWKPIRIPEAGSYLGAFDMLLDGGESIIAGPGQRLLRGTDVKPKNSGDWGLSGRWSPWWLEGTLGMYYRKTSDIQPQIHIQPGAAALPAAICNALGFTSLNASTCHINPSAASIPQILNGNVGQYYEIYPSNIDILGISLSKSVAGVSVGADLNYRRNMPLNSDPVLILPAALAAMTPGAISALPTQGKTGGAVGDTWHGVVNLLGTVAKTQLFDTASWLAELQWNHWSKVTQGSDVFQGRDSYTGIDKVSKNFVGLSINFTPTWYQVYPGIDVQLPIAYSVGLSGTSAVASGGWKDAGSFSIGVGADIDQKHRIDLSYVGYFGPFATNAMGQITSSRGITPLLKDRGFVSLTLKTTF